MTYIDDVISARASQLLAGAGGSAQPTAARELTAVTYIDDVISARASQLLTGAGGSAQPLAATELTAVTYIDDVISARLGNSDVTSYAMKACGDVKS